MYRSPYTRTKAKEITLRLVRLSIAARATILGLVLVPVIGVQLTLAGDRAVVVSGRPPSGEDFDATNIRISFSRVARSLSKPVFITHAGDDSGRLFIVEQGGRIKILRNGTVLATPFLNISAKVSKGSEQGLLGLAFHPDYEAKGEFYIYYTDVNGDIVIARHMVSANADVATATGLTILKIGHPTYTNHNGGMLAFGPDRYLYAGTGDGGSSGDPGNRAQSLSSLLGKILRIDIDNQAGGKNYAIPPGNPYAGVAGLDEIWSFGLRNPWRFSFDGRTDDLWIGDVGQNRYEEIDRSLAPNAGRAANYGWRQLEGNACYNPATNCRRTGKTMPLAVYSHSLGCSVTGGYVYRGTTYPDLGGVYLFGDYCSGRIWGVDANGPNTQTPVQLVNTAARISSFGEDQVGNLYLVDHAGDIWLIRDV